MGEDRDEEWFARIDLLLESFQMRWRQRAIESGKRAEEWRKKYEESKAAIEHRNQERMLLKREEKIEITEEKLQADEKIEEKIEDVEENTEIEGEAIKSNSDFEREDPKSDPDFEREDTKSDSDFDREETKSIAKNWPGRSTFETTKITNKWKKNDKGESGPIRVKKIKLRGRTYLEYLEDAVQNEGTKSLNTNAAKKRKKALRRKKIVGKRRRCRRQCKASKAKVQRNDHRRCMHRLEMKTSKRRRRKRWRRKNTDNSHCWQRRRLRAKMKDPSLGEEDGH